MAKVLGEYYAPILYAMWVVWVPMVVKGEFGFVAALYSAIVATGIALLLTTVTSARSAKTKLITLVGSAALLIGFAALVIEPEAPASSSASQLQAKQHV